MKPLAAWLRSQTPGRRILILLMVTGLVLLLAPSVVDAEVYGNIAPAPQITGGALIGRYPLGHYELDESFSAISVGFLSVNTSGLLPMVAYFITQVIWLVTAFIANAVVTLFAFAFSLDLVNGNGTAGSGALAPISQAIQHIYQGAFGRPWLIAAIALVSMWAMWKALVQRRYSETAGSLAVSAVYCLIALFIVTQPQRSIAPVSKLVDEVSTSLLSLTSNGEITGEEAAKRTASNQLFSLLVVEPWTVLEFGGLEHCTTQTDGHTVPVPARPLSSNAAEEQTLATSLQNGKEIHTSDGKTCINNQTKYAPHFLAYGAQSKQRDHEVEALSNGSDQDLPETDPAKDDPSSYPLGPADKPAAEAFGPGGQLQRLLLSIVILIGEIGAWLLLGALAAGVLIAGVCLLATLAFAPFALVIGVIPGRGHAFFRAWLSRLANYLARKVICSAILAVILAVCNALADATSSLGWLMAFGLQALFLWVIFLQRARISAEFLAATSGHARDTNEIGHLRGAYYASRLARMAISRQPPTKGEALEPEVDMAAPRTQAPDPSDDYDQTPVADSEGTSMPPGAYLPNSDKEPSTPLGPNAPRGAQVPEPGEEYDALPIAVSEGPLMKPGASFAPDPDEEPA